MAADILIVDDEADIRELVAGILQDEGYAARTARDSDEALAAVVARRPNLVFLDIWLQGSRLDGLQLLDTVKQDHPDLPVVMISGHGNIETAVAAIKRGAYDFIEKPFKADRLVLVAERALETSRLKREVKQLKQLGAVGRRRWSGARAAIDQLRQTIEKVGADQQPHPHRRPVGRRQGAGRAHHPLSCRRAPTGRSSSSTPPPSRPSAWKSNCSASTGRNGSQEPQARRARRGAWRHAVHRRVADMPRETQNKILRVLVDQTFQRVGGSTKVAVDVRIVSSTARNLEAEIADGKIPRGPLSPAVGGADPRAAAGRAARGHPRAGRIFHGRRFRRATGLPKRRIGDDAMAVLQSHDWPGNVRQLRNNVERLMILAGGDPEAVHRRQHAAAGRRLDGAGNAERQWRRASDGPAAARRARSVRARISGGADQPLRRQYLAHRRIRRHGALGAAPQAQGAGDRLSLARIPESGNRLSAAASSRD